MFINPRKLLPIKSEDRPWTPTEAGSGTGRVAKKHNKLRAVLGRKNPPRKHRDRTGQSSYPLPVAQTQDYDAIETSGTRLQLNDQDQNHAEP